MIYEFSLGGTGWQMVPCMVTLLGEVRDCVDAGLLHVTNLGQLGDAAHQAEPTSRHNPAKAPDGDWYVCAADFGGTDYSRLADFHQALYKAQDPRVHNHGFCQWGDGYGLSWYDGGREWTGRDQGHCHFDVTMKNASLDSDWWVDSLASTAPWGLADFLRTGHLTTQSGTAVPIQQEDDLPYTEEQLRDIVSEKVTDVMRSPEFSLIVGRAVGSAVRSLIPSIAAGVWGQLMSRKAADGTVLGGDKGAPATNFVTAVLEDTRKILAQIGAKS